MSPRTEAEALAAAEPDVGLAFVEALIEIGNTLSRDSWALVLAEYRARQEG